MKIIGGITRHFFYSIIIMAAWHPAISGTDGTGNRLDSCISLYRNGEYQKSNDGLSALLPSLTGSEDSLAALKYLGYSSGMLNRIYKAKEYFSIALEKYPAFNIDTLECPPNITLIFNQVKLEKAMAKISNAPPPKQEIIKPAKSLVVPVFLLTAAVAAAAGGGYLGYEGNSLHQKYRAVGLNDPNRQASMDRYYRESIIAYAECAVCGGVSLVLLPVSISIFSRKGSGNSRISISFTNGIPALALDF